MLTIIPAVKTQDTFRDFDTAARLATVVVFDCMVTSAGLFRYFCAIRRITGGMVAEKRATWRPFGVYDGQAHPDQFFRPDPGFERSERR